jgi:hypothetical protein
VTRRWKVLKLRVIYDSAHIALVLVLLHSLCCNDYLIITVFCLVYYIQTFISLIRKVALEGKVVIQHPCH